MKKSAPVRTGAGSIADDAKGLRPHEGCDHHDCTEAGHGDLPCGVYVQEPTIATLTADLAAAIRRAEEADGRETQEHQHRAYLITKVAILRTALEQLIVAAQETLRLAPWPPFTVGSKDANDQTLHAIHKAVAALKATE